MTDRWLLRIASLPPWLCCGRRGLHMPTCIHSPASSVQPLPQSAASPTSPGG